MTLEHSFSSPLRAGFHLRASHLLVKTARLFKSEVVLTNQANGHSTDCESFAVLLTLGIRFNDPCLLKVSGPDEEQAIARMVDLICNALPLAERLGRFGPEAAAIYGSVNVLYK